MSVSYFSVMALAVALGVGVPEPGRHASGDATRASGRERVHADTSRPAPRRSPRVWANKRSRIYHCPGSKWYGIGKNGHWMTEAQAKTKGYRGAYNRACGT